MGTGGARSGAGRPASNVKAEECRRIDVRRWAREGCTRPGAAGSWSWLEAKTGELTASISYAVTMDGNTVVLSFGLNGEPMRQRVPIERTACRYGGDRAWFICPRCSDRRAVLFLRSAGFGCRRCNRIAYRSQSEDALGRVWLKQSKAEAKLGESWERPKGMHRATREKLMATICACEEFREAAIDDFCRRHAHLL